MSSFQAPCPSSSLLYNKTLCACKPGYFFNATTRSCTLFEVSPSEWVINSGIDYSIAFPETIFSFDEIKKFTQSQAVFLETTAILLLSWLVFCVIARFGKLGDGRSVWFKIRWWISRLDVCFSTRHWLDDQNAVVKRKTELGGTFSVASWILFVGLFAALLYQMISKRSVEVHQVRATNGPDLVTFVNDFEFNITTISRMSCSQLRGLGTMVSGSPGFIDYRTTSLSTFGNYSCHNTSRGPTISLTCNNCPLTQDNAYISWQFVDIPNEPAIAVGFQFNLSARNTVRRKHVSLVSGILKNGSNTDNVPITFRGFSSNVLKFNLFPRVYHNKHELKLVQPLFHEFLPGSSISNASQLQSALQSSTGGLINTTLFINFLTDYIVEVDSQNLLGPVGFLANVGGLYCFSIGIFLCLLVKCEYRIKRLRTEDQVLKNIRNQRKAQDNWEKLRKYVMFTWNVSSLKEEYNIPINDGCCARCLVRKNKTLHKRSQQETSLQTVSFNKTPTSTDVKVQIDTPQPVKAEHMRNNLVGTAACNASMLGSNDIPPPPTLPDFKGSSSIDVLNIQKSLKDLYEYNAMLRDKLVATQSMLEGLAAKRSAVPSDPQSRT